MSELVVGIHEAKTHLSKLLKQVQAGDTIVSSRYGKPVARIIGIDRPATRSPENPSEPDGRS